MLHVDIPQYNSAKHERESRKCTCTWKLLVYSLLFQPRDGGGDSQSEKVGVVHLTSSSSSYMYTPRRN